MRGAALPGLPDSSSLPSMPAFLQFNSVANACLKAGLGDKAEEVMEARDYL
jgi:hypothetical protein